VKPHVVGSAQPTNIQWLGVVIMVGVASWIAADFAWLTDKIAPLERIGHFAVCEVLGRVYALLLTFLGCAFLRPVVLQSR
jgi:hypothetical protein